MQRNSAYAARRCPPFSLCYIKSTPASVVLGAPLRLNSAHPCFQVLCVLLCLPQHGWRLVLET